MSQSALPRGTAAAETKEVAVENIALHPTNRSALDEEA
jgi:hypothetical protein